MKVIRGSEVAAQPVEEEGAREVTVRWLISRPEGAPNFAMRLFEVRAGGCTPRHEHPWEHEVYVVEGNLEVVGPRGPVPAGPGDAVFVPPGEAHQFRNAGEGVARMLCMIPLPPQP